MMSTSETPSLLDLARSIDTADAGSITDRIRDTHDLIGLADRRLHELVGEARRAGTSWQAIGEALGVSRQAAFKRFGADDTPDAAAASVDLMERTTHVFELLAADDYAGVRELMSYSCARVLTKRRLMGTWRQVVDATGRLRACRNPIVQTPDGRTSLERFVNRHLAQGAVVQTTLEHERGEWMGRVAYNGTGAIVGILIAPPGASELPF